MTNTGKPAEPYPHAHNVVTQSAPHVGAAHGQVEADHVARERASGAPVR